MLIQAAKKEISDYFRKQNFEVLDLFYKMPCNSCITVEKWDHFEFFPDILLKKNEKLILCFVIFSKVTLSKCEEFIKKPPIGAILWNTLFELVTLSFNF